MARKSIKQQAREILEASIADIKAGLWRCGGLAEACPIGEKNPGCALGLVGLNAGIFPTYEDIDYWRGGEKVMRARESYPSEGDGWAAHKNGKAALLAVKALSETTKLSKGQLNDLRNAYHDDALELTERIVWGYNDLLGHEEKSKALAWFRRALKTLD